MAGDWVDSAFAHMDKQGLYPTRGGKVFDEDRVELSPTDKLAVSNECVKAADTIDRLLRRIRDVARATLGSRGHLDGAIARDVLGESKTLYEAARKIHATFTARRPSRVASALKTLEPHIDKIEATRVVMAEDLEVAACGERRAILDEIRVALDGLEELPLEIDARRLEIRVRSCPTAAEEVWIEIKVPKK